MSVFDRLRIVAAAALLATAFAVRAPTQPTGTTTVSNPREVRRVERFTHVAAFLNLAQGTVRLVAIVPTDSRASLAAVDTVASIVLNNPSKRLRAYVILRGGNEAESSIRAAILAGRASDSRIVVLWDQTAAVSEYWKPGTTPGVWLYDTSATFGEQLPKASLVVAAPAGPDARLNGAALRDTSYELVRTVEAKMGRSGGGP
jgi:hypothetical protein